MRRMMTYKPYGNITYRDKTLANNTVASSLAIAKPSVTDGTFLIAVVTTSSGTLSSASSLFTIASGVSGSLFFVGYRYIPIAANETATSYTFNNSSTLQTNYGFIAAFDGCDPGNPVDSQSTVRSTSGTNTAVPSVTLTRDGQLLVASIILNVSNSITVPSGMTQQFQDNANQDRALATQTRVARGSIGSKNWTNVTATNIISSAFVLNPSRM